MTNCCAYISLINLLPIYCVCNLTKVDITLAITCTDMYLGISPYEILSCREQMLHSSKESITILTTCILCIQPNFFFVFWGLLNLSRHSWWNTMHTHCVCFSHTNHSNITQHLLWHQTRYHPTFAIQYMHIICIWTCYAFVNCPVTCTHEESGCISKSFVELYGTKEGVIQRQLTAIQMQHPFTWA